MVIELVVTRTDLERNKFVDVDDSLRDAGEVFAADEWLQAADKFVITIGWHISVMGFRIVFALSADAVENERHLAISKFKSLRCPARPAAKGIGTNRCKTWNLCSSRYFLEQKHR